MHGSVREGLEDWIAAKPTSAASRAADHVSGCAECASMAATMRGQSQLFKTLQAAGAEPSAGFYARVMQRIEESARRSIWWVFVYSPVGKRLAYASLALSLALGTYVIAAERNDGHLLARDIPVQSAAVGNHYDPPVVGTADEQRAAVLENFVAHPQPAR